MSHCVYLTVSALDPWFLLLTTLSLQHGTVVDMPVYVSIVAFIDACLLDRSSIADTSVLMQ